MVYLYKVRGFVPYAMRGGNSNFLRINLTKTMQCQNSIMGKECIFTNAQDGGNKFISLGWTCIGKSINASAYVFQFSASREFA